MAANKKFTAIVLFAYFYLNQARAQYQNLCCNNTKEHCQRIYGRIGYCRCVVIGCLVAICKCRWIGVASRQQTKDREIIELVFSSGDDSYYQQWEECYHETIQNPLKTCAVEYCFGEIGSGGDTYRRKE